MLDMFHIGFKILFDGYLMIRLFLSQFALIINHFLFDGYLTIAVNNPGFLCDGYVTGRQKSLFDGYLTELRFGSVLSPYQVRYFIGTSQTSPNLKAND